MSSEAPQTKKFQKGERTITPAAQKASKYYPAEDEAQPKKVRERAMLEHAIENGNPQAHVLTLRSDPQSSSTIQASRIAQARFCPYPLSWSIPRQARRPPEDPRSRRAPRNRSLQAQRCAPPPRQCPLRNRHEHHRTTRRHRRTNDREGGRREVLRPGQEGRQEGQ